MAVKAPVAATAPAPGSVATSILALGAEFAMLGIATLIAASSDSSANIILTFMVGLLILFLMYHTAFTGAIPNLFKLVAPTATNTIAG